MVSLRMAPSATCFLLNAIYSCRCTQPRPVHSVTHSAQHLHVRPVSPAVPHLPPSERKLHESRATSGPRTVPSTKWTPKIRPIRSRNEQHCRGFHCINLTQLFCSCCLWVTPVLSEYLALLKSAFAGIFFTTSPCAQIRRIPLYPGVE